MNGHREELNRVLDDAGDDARCMTTATAQPEASLADQVQVLATEKQRAEAEAEERSRMLLVHQDQLVEHARERARASASLVAEARRALEESQGSSTAAALQQLLSRLEEDAEEAHLFAEQQARDALVLRKQQGASKAAREDAQLAGDAAGGNGHVEENGAAGGREQGDALGGTQDELEEEMMQAMGVRSFAERAKYIPLRLSLEQRRLLRLLEGALAVSEYTDKIDILTWRSKTGRMNAEIKSICALLCGLVVAEDFTEGQKLIRDRDFVANASFFRSCFEVGRRYKIMNPDRMRSDYGKLIYMLMDSADLHVRELLEFDCVKPLLTVGRFLEERGASAMLEDPLMEIATAEIIAGDRPRQEIDRDIRRKEKARDTLAHKYKSRAVAEDELLSCIYSLSDNNTYLLFNRDPIDKMITYLTTYFSPQQEPGPYSLAIQSGRGGARLTHNHERQYHYVLQSLTLWREISTDMFKLWCLAEEDMLDPANRYRLADTGQGLNRIQPAPRTYRAISRIVSQCQQRIGHWVGSAVIHLGDHNVPNAFMFIDKYTQVPRILNPIVLVLEEIPKLYRDPHTRQYIDSLFGGVDGARRAILCDFFKHGFDGSGADNFFDAGSCIDGRLTSAWAWCSKLEKKPYYTLFKMAGFSGFDGEFK